MPSSFCVGPTIIHRLSLKGTINKYEKNLLFYKKYFGKATSSLYYSYFQLAYYSVWIELWHRSYNGRNVNTRGRFPLYKPECKKNTEWLMLPVIICSVIVPASKVPGPNCMMLPMRERGCWWVHPSPARTVFGWEPGHLPLPNIDQTVTCCRDEPCEIPIKRSSSLGLLGYNFYIHLQSKQCTLLVL